MVSQDHGTHSFKGYAPERRLSSSVDCGRNTLKKRLDLYQEKRIWEMRMTKILLIIIGIIEEIRRINLIDYLDDSKLIININVTSPISNVSQVMRNATLQKIAPKTKDPLR